MVNSEFNSNHAQLTNSFGIYVHIPFCVHKCSYCDFYSFTKYQEADFKRFTEVLCDEIRQAQKSIQGWAGQFSPVTSLFFGGGTPSLLPVEQLKKILDVLKEHFAFTSGTEITLEANPETVNEGFLEKLRSLTAVNRISLGAQSFSESNLQKLERLGSRESIYHAARLLKQFGFNNFNLDLIFAIPGQSEKQMLEDLDEVVSLEPRHVSSYNLTLKPGHVLYERLPEDDSVAELYEKAVDKLESSGYTQYEISNFSKPNACCQHNLLYWSGGDFLGLGPSASSRFFRDGVFHHRKQWSDFSRYLSQKDFEEIAFEKTTLKQTWLEATFLELRKNKGIDLNQFSKRYGYNPSQAKQFPLFEREGLITREGENLKLTRKGKLLADLVTERLVDV